MIEIEVLTEIENMLAAVTEADIARTARSLTETRENDQPLGVIHSLEIRRLWSLAFVCDGRGVMAHADCHYKANSDEEAAVLREAADFYGAMAKMIRSIAWTQAKRDIGGAAWQAEHIAIRSGWMLVDVPQGPPDFRGGLIQFMRGGGGME